MAVLDKILFELVHVLLWLYTLVVRTWLRWKRKPNVINIEINRRKRTLRRCRVESKSLHKLPHHLSLVFLEDKISFHDVANIVVWCAAVGVSYITVYDSQGLLKRHSQDLTYHITEKQKLLLEMEESKFTIEVFHQQSESTVSENHNRIDDCSLSNSKQCKTRLHVLGPQDGQPNLVRAAKQYCNDSMHQTFQETAEEAEVHINRMIQEMHNFPDPDLIFKFGSVSSLLGFLPWQIRLTEIISYPSHHDFDYKSFLHLLHVFARTEQRFGK